MRTLVAVVGFVLLTNGSIHAENSAVPTVNSVIRTSTGFTIAIDRSSQQLQIDLEPQKPHYAAEVSRGQTVEVSIENAPVQLPEQVVARLAQGRVLFARAEKGSWVYVHFLESGKVLDGWIHKQFLRPHDPGAALHRVPKRADADFASAAMLIQKGKQFDDGLYAAVELAMQNGLGPITGKKDWLLRLAQNTHPEVGGSPLVNLYAAIQLGGQSITPPEALRPPVAKTLSKFRGDELRSKPLGFYNWSPELEQIFRQDRMLQSAADTKSPTAIVALAELLARDADLRRNYVQMLRLTERLSNPLRDTDYRSLFPDIDARRAVQLDPDKLLRFLPPSRSHETELLKKLFANRSPPAGFQLMPEVIKRLRNGQLSFRPTPESGWYDYQLWSLEPLVRLDKTAEAQRLHPNNPYRVHLEELFKGTYALMRETHVKQMPPISLMVGIPQPRKEREKVYVEPNPHVELLPTMYLRRAESYRYVREVLEETFGREHVGQLHRLTIYGPVKMNLSAELDWMTELFQGAHITASRELGMPDPISANNEQATADKQAETFLRWVEAFDSDPDLSADSRMMVPVFFDQARQMTKVWLLLGWEESPCEISFRQWPGLKITDRDGQLVSGDDAPEIIFRSSHRSLATPVFAEVYVTKLLNRAEFRRHCDVYQTKAAILASLE